MAPHKVHHAGRLKGQRFIMGVVGSVFFLMCVQFWLYDRNWPRDELDFSGKTFKSMLRKLPRRNSWFRFQDHQEAPNYSTSSLREMLQSVSVCVNDSSSTSGEVNMETAACLAKLLEEYPALKALQHVIGEEGSSQQRSSDRVLIESLETQITELSEKLEQSTVFLELKDSREPGLTDTDRNWFMSSLRDPMLKDGYPEAFEFPSKQSQDRILCLMGNHTRDGTKNKYGLAWKGYVPPGSTLLPGLTFVADNYWDYNNIWHAMSALVYFVSWRAQQDTCVVPERLVLYHWGELVPQMGSWIENLLHVSFGRRLDVVQKELGGGKPVCFERAIVNRRGLGGMSLPHINSMVDVIRCRARKYCGVDAKSTQGMRSPASIRMTLLVRTGARAFKDVDAVTQILERECKKFGICYLEVSSVSNLNFCEQVALMSRTDVLVSTHGAQLTNMMFVSKGGSVMEMMPKGWLEFAGVGQYIYTWLAEWSSLQHEGIWRDPEGPDCPYPTSETLKCFFVYKDNSVGHNETHLIEWTRTALQGFSKRRGVSLVKENQYSEDTHCKCEKDDYVYNIQVDTQSTKVTSTTAAKNPDM